MKNAAICWAIVLGIAGWCFRDARASSAEPDSVVQLQLEQSEFLSGRIDGGFTLLDDKNGSTISPDQLEVVHQKKLHLFILDEGLQELRHEHPEFLGNKWRFSAELLRSGRYRVFAQGQMKRGDEFVAEADLALSGVLPPSTSPPVLSEMRSGQDRGSRVTLQSGRLRAKKMAMLTIRFSREDGSRPEIRPWLGALLHAAIVPQNMWSTPGALIHAHPMEHAGELMIHTVFPSSGMYRVWIQFQDAGVIRTVPLAVRVDP